jgi:hypothetical protein
MARRRSKTGIPRLDGAQEGIEVTAIERGGGGSSQLHILLRQRPVQYLAFGSCRGHE